MVYRGSAAPWGVRPIPAASGRNSRLGHAHPGLAARYAISAARPPFGPGIYPTNARVRGWRRHARARRSADCAGATIRLHDRADPLPPGAAPRAAIRLTARDRAANRIRQTVPGESRRARLWDSEPTVRVAWRSRERHRGREAAGVPWRRGNEFSESGRDGRCRQRWLRGCFQALEYNPRRQARGP